MAMATENTMAMATTKKYYNCKGNVWHHQQAGNRKDNDKDTSAKATIICTTEMATATEIAMAKNS